MLQVRPYGLIAYYRREWHITGKHKKEITTALAQEQKERNAKFYTGKITPYSKKRLKRAIQLLVATAIEKEAINFRTGKTFKFKVNFITLTLPAPQGDVSDKILKKQVLDNFIKRCRRKYNLRSYVWRAERQKNKNLHFHMISDTYIHYEKLRQDWNACLKQLGFIESYKSKHANMTLADYLKAYPPTKRTTIEKREKAYKQGVATGWEQPNSTDVHSIIKIKNLTQYFVKYMAKDAEEGDTVEGKLWDCSANLKIKNNCECLLEGIAQQTWEEVLADPTIKVKHDTIFSMAFLNSYEFKHYIKGELLKMYNDYLKGIREFESSPRVRSSLQGATAQAPHSPFAHKPGSYSQSDIAFGR